MEMPSATIGAFDDTHDGAVGRVKPFGKRAVGMLGIEGLNLCALVFREVANS